MNGGFPCHVTEWDSDVKGPEKHLFGTHPLQFRCFTSVPLFSGWALKCSHTSAFSSPLSSCPERLISKDSKLSRGFCSPKRSFRRRESSEWGPRLLSTWCRCGRVALHSSKMCGSRCSVPFGDQLHASTIPRLDAEVRAFFSSHSRA